MVSGFTWFRVFDLRGDDLTLELYSTSPETAAARARALRSRSRGIAGSGYCINHSSRIWFFSEKSHTHEMLTDGRESMLAGRMRCRLHAGIPPHTDPTLALMRWGFFE